MRPPSRPPSNYSSMSSASYQQCPNPEDHGHQRDKVFESVTEDDGYGGLVDYFVSRK